MIEDKDKPKIKKIKEEYPELEDLMFDKALLKKDKEKKKFEEWRKNKPKRNF